MKGRRLYTLKIRDLETGKDIEDFVGNLFLFFLFIFIKQNFLENIAPTHTWVKQNNKFQF